MDALLQSGLIQTGLWIGLILFLALRFGDAIRDSLLPRVSGIGFMGARLDLYQRIVEDGLDKPGALPPPAASREILDRLKAAGDTLRETSILWLDDHPVRNAVERRFLARAGIWVETVTSTEEARDALQWARFDLVISDMERDHEEPAPLITEVARTLLDATPVIYYVGEVDRAKGVPPSAHAIVDSPDGLYRLIFDILSPSVREPTGRRTMSTPY